MGGCKRGSLRELGQEIQRKVYQYTCIPVSIGVAETKTLAKLANYIAKGSEKAAGVLDLTRSPYQEAALTRTPVEKVWGIGPAYAKLLRQAGIGTALALRDADTRWVRKKMTVVGARIVMELRGVSCLPLETCPSPRKSVTVSRSFPVCIETLEEIREAVAIYTTRAAEKLRAANLAASVMTVFIETGRFDQGPCYSQSLTASLFEHKVPTVPKRARYFNSTRALVALFFR